MPPTAHGVYILANDRIYDLAVAFLNSFRLRCPSLPLCLVPFDNDVRRITALASRFGFSVFADQTALRRCDDLSIRFHGRIQGQYRKLAMWQGPFEKFIYIDVDTIVLRPVEFVFSLLGEFDVVASHSNIAGCRKYVWKDGTVPGSDLSQAEIDYAASTGFIASRRGVIGGESMGRVVEAALRWKPSMELMCMEQPLLNYLIVRSTSRYTSLFLLGQESADTRYPCECWAGDPDWRIEPGGEAWYQGRPTPVLLVHWAGQWAPVGVEKMWKLFLLALGFRARYVRRDLRQGHVWRVFRDMNPPAAASGSAVWSVTENARQPSA